MRMKKQLLGTFMVERITDISNDVCDFLSTCKDDDMTQHKMLVEDLVRLYEYHKSNHHIHPMTNWHAHRLRCMSGIAATLKDKVKIWECHFLILEYYYERSRCTCHCHSQSWGMNHDFFHRDSLNYLVYGSQALANACVYVKPFTKYDYGDVFKPILEFLKPYLDKKKKHIEYVHSEIVSDKEKEEYGKEWNPSYASTFLRIVPQVMM